MVPLSYYMILSGVVFVTGLVGVDQKAGDGLDVAVLAQCLSEFDESRIESDIAEATRLGIATTPTFVLGMRHANGDIQIVSRINGAQPYSVFRDALNELVVEARKNSRRRDALSR